MMLTRLKAGMHVRIIFTRSHKKDFPFYCGMWDGKRGEVVETISNLNFVRILVEGRELCLERENVRPLPVVVRPLY